MLKYLWALYNKDILFEEIIQTNLVLSIAKKSLYTLEKNKSELLSGIDVGYKYETTAERFQHFLTPFNGKDYRMYIYSNIEHHETAYKKLIEVLPEKYHKDFPKFIWNIHNKKYFLEDHLQLLYIMWVYRDKDFIGREYETLVKTARRCTYDLSHLGSIHPSDEQMVNVFYTQNYIDTFTVKGFSKKYQTMVKLCEYYFDLNNRLDDKLRSLNIPTPDGVDIIPF